MRLGPIAPTREVLVAALVCTGACGRVLRPGYTPRMKRGHRKRLERQPSRPPSTIALAALPFGAAQLRRRA